MDSRDTYLLYGQEWLLQKGWNDLCKKAAFRLDTIRQYIRKEHIYPQVLFVFVILAFFQKFHGFASMFANQFFSQFSIAFFKGFNYCHMFG